MLIKKWLIRIPVIFFWIALIFGALYLPKWSLFSSSKNTLNIFAWGDILDPAVIRDFERRTGAKIHLNYYASNEELLVKLKATRGVGYDLIVPSDYAVKILSQEGLLKDLDTSKFDFWTEINPSLLHHEFDPENRYSIPFAWEVFGLGIDKNYFENNSLNPSWKMIFDPAQMPYKIAMINDPLEALNFAAFYLYGPVSHLDPEQSEKVKELLVAQKSRVAAYASFRGDYFLATKNCPVVVASSSYIRRSMRQFPFVGFALPKEGTFISIENICLSKETNKTDLAYKFINFLYRPKSIVSHYKTYGFFPARLGVLKEQEIDAETQKLMNATPDEFKPFHFTQMILSSQQIRDLWIEIKSGG